jgi:hypothetical protein
LDGGSPGFPGGILYTADDADYGAGDGAPDGQVDDASSHYQGDQEDN